VEIFLAIAFVALILGLWAFAMYRFRMGWWTLVAALALLAVLFAVFFRPEDEDSEGQTPESFAAGATV
jgi:hypothetical protein